MGKAKVPTGKRWPLLASLGALISMLACGCVVKELAVPGADAIRLTRIAGTLLTAQPWGM